MLLSWLEYFLHPCRSTAKPNPKTRCNIIRFIIHALSIKKVQSRSLCKKQKKNKKKYKATLAEYLPLCLHCAEPAAAPRSEQSDPEAVVRLEAGRKNINLLYYSCTRKTISAIRTQGICVHVFSCLHCGAFLWKAIASRMPCIVHKMQLLPFDSSKSCRMWKKAAPKVKFG